MGRHGWRGLVTLATLLAGCELVVDFDRDRIVDDAGVDLGETLDDLGTDEDLGTDDDMGADEDLGVEDMGAEDLGPVDMGDVDAFMCTAAAECDDSDACTVDDCAAGACTNTADPCDDGNACTGTTCDTGTGCEYASLCSVTGGTLALDLTTAITVPSVTAGADGFVAVFANDGTTLYGSAAVSAGTTADVVVPLTVRLGDGEMLVVRLYEDAGVIGTFEPGTDIVANDGADVEATVTVTVASGTPDIEVTVAGDGADYTFTLDRSAMYAPAASLTGMDPDVTLFDGLRYRVINTTPGAHPFELITDATDTPQLSQAVDPALESDVTIDWTEVGGEVEFTVGATMSAVVDAYRCSIHTGSMTGGVTYSTL
mgnify:CR=1 FL=1